MKPNLPRLLLAIALPLALAQPLPAAAQQEKKTQRAAKPAGPDKPKPANIDRNGVLILVRSALLAVDQANKTGNYTVLRDLGAPGLQANTAAQLAEIFASQRKRGLDLAGVAVLEPQLTLLPQIETNGMLHMAGFFPSVPLRLNFELLFAPADHQWKLFGISVDLGNNSPQAPDGPQAPAPTAAAETPVAPAATIATKQKGGTN
ncbi:MAG: hypothetical protein E5V92_06470 [Mesorhizobium sp.]|uniref:hypothetical protein n=1 Tax=unclassified Mesorhizobium TaxID=325217 RepID=UPI000F75F608|nr:MULTISPECIES: hypothetical protein [unclassified Mesorhizobium]AZO74139.1 hypothetical protein EJ067_25595 [Mesorhizobium sp. M1D.F.Ca.ET.043.01.1.1]RWA79593.1 MAG: hypothetical protein EOQ32_31725 [Mesorhizobium sp.]RWE16850.1 MAG: hypothetical protein EOS61_05045 [Mesorhizobium sp.]TJW88156.1 MAG: hypothetical protein E5V92_06470 [Mesorhizobium sp.]